MKHLAVVAALAAALGSGLADAQSAQSAQTARTTETAPAPDTSRGALLYENHCGACHGQQMHWREKRAVSDMDSLRAMVRRWQGVAQLNWSDDEIADVARHLNTRFYRFEDPRL